DERVRYVEWNDPEYAVISFVPNDSLYSNSGHWGSKKIGAEAAWDRTTGSTSVKVAMIDSGVFATHEDLVGGRLLAGWDFVNNDATPNDESGCSYHGTHTTGTAGATINNAKGIAGMSQHTILPIKGLGYSAPYCTASDTQLANSLKYAADQASHVSSNSWGGGPVSVTINDAVQYAHNLGTIHIAAAGNSGPCTNCVGEPWKSKASISIIVASTTSTDTQSSFSSEGPEVDVSAPGSSILSLGGGVSTYQTLSGTSMAAPHVAGTAALLKTLNPTWAFADVDNRLKTTAVDLGPAGWDTDFGYGRINADAATAGAPPPGCSGGPANNCFANSVSLTSPASVTVTTTGATMETGEPAPCGSLGATVWYHFTAAASGTATIDTVGGSTNYDTVLAAYTGSAVGSLTNVACNDDFSGTQSQISFACTAGTTYRVQLGGWQAATGTATLDLSGCTAAAGPVLNENFDDGVANGWTTGGLWRVSSTCVTASSSPNTLQYNQAATCNYATGARTTGSATTPALNIASIGAPTLAFSTRYTKENYAGGAYDIMRVQVSTNGGSTWTTLWQRDSRNADQTTFTAVSLSLTSYKTTGTLVRFNFDSVDGTANSYLGWIVDNVVVQ
ncbi:MAG: S8 family serine peptidase, partial [Methanobacteriota archaeon]